MNYNTLRNKPTINHKELIGNTKASDIGGMTEEDMKRLLTTDLTSYYTKDQIDDLFSRSFVYREKSGSIVTFDCPSTSQSIPELTVGIEATQSGSGDPSPTNVRPISGWSVVNVTRCGKNLWGGEKLADDIVAKVPNATKDTTNKTVSYSAGYVDGKVLFDNFKPNTRYTIFMMTSSATNNIRVIYTDGTIESISKGTITVTQANKSIECLRGIWLTGTTILNYEDCGVFEGVLTAQDFEPYNGQTYTIDLDGTRYGGTLDVVSGVLTLTDGFIPSYNGETLPSTWISDRDVYAEGTTPTIGAEVCYKLATPLTIQLTPTDVKSLLGTNNLCADSGDITVKALDKIIQG